MMGHAEKACPESFRRVRQWRSRAFVGLRAHRLGALRAVRPRALRVRSGRQAYSAEVALGYEVREPLRPCWVGLFEQVPCL